MTIPTTVTFKALRQGQVYERCYNGRYSDSELFRIDRKRTFGGHVSIEYSAADRPSGGFPLTAQGRGSTGSGFTAVRPTWQRAAGVYQPMGY